jgi:hypothetical protein
MTLPAMAKVPESNGWMLASLFARPSVTRGSTVPKPV